MKNTIYWVTESAIDSVEIDDRVCTAAVQTDDVVSFIASIFGADPRSVSFETDGARDAADDLFMEAYATAVNSVASGL